MLVVEDDPTVAEVGSEYLRRAGNRLRVAATVAAALRAADEQPPDVIVLDVRLPDGNGSTSAPASAATAAARCPTCGRTAWQG